MTLPVTGDGNRSQPGPKQPISSLDERQLDRKKMASGKAGAVQSELYSWIETCLLAVMSLLILFRRISRYDGPDPWFLGLFNNNRDAEAAREAYVREMTSCDTWAKQCYRESDLINDTQIAALDDFRTEFSSLSTILVSAVWEGMGQVSRQWLGVFSELSDASDYVQLELRRNIEHPDYYTADQVTLNLVERRDVLDFNSRVGVNSIFDDKIGLVTPQANDRF